ncbi:antA/AntB antirepressor family protein [Clostridium saccharoperbutylacetonicum]|uniref:antA/AntB antirepressor family protein n=1 Tax=Clostridium saccharoperbutylacetonicum TaxID=36745 RepID=UPI0039E986AB
MSNLVKNNIKEEKTNLTPIEIALGIDEEGRTTAKKLYNFLELEPKNYSRWCKSKITENEFAIENIDFIPFVINEECGGQATTDYKLSASFAKKLAMGTHNKKGEAAKNYFIKVEEKLKEIATQSETVKPKCIEDVLISSLQEMKELKGEVQAVKAGIEETNTKLDGIKEVVALNSTDWKNDSRKLVVKIAHKIGGNEFINEVYKEIYSNLERRAGCQLKIRLVNKQKKMALEGVCKSKINAVSKLDVIGEDKKLLECFLAITKEIAIKYKYIKKSLTVKSNLAL